MPVNVVKPRRISAAPRRHSQRTPLQESQAAESRAIASQMHRSRNPRLESLLARQESRNRDNPLDSDRQNPSLQYLAIAQRPDQQYQIVLRANTEPFIRSTFETIEHCTEAASELENTFDLRRFYEGATGETMEVIQAIAQEHQLRETVACTLCA